MDPEIAVQTQRANEVLDDYRALLSRSRVNQLRFNAALLFGSLIIVALAILAALRMADRLVRPVGQLVTAAGRIEQGDFSSRVSVAKTEDEIQTLASAFNRMSGRLEEQTSALMSANAQLDTRRAFTEAVLSSVTAGVIALDANKRILLINRSAENLLQQEEETLEGVSLAAVSPELDEFMQDEQREADVLVASKSGQRTLAVKRVRYHQGAVITFDDITDQLSDQRRAAWSDIARRIAHEIKNPLTPIQLAAERLQRRFGKEIASDGETFERLTGTIVRQVGDLRRMVDEFSNFARMPKPVFRMENVHEIARQSLFLHEVAHPGISFSISPPEGDFQMVCDRRQLGQALSNVVKNAVEAIEARRSRGEHNLAGDRVDLKVHRQETADRHRRDRHGRWPAGRSRAADRAVYDDAGARHRPRPRDRQEDRRGAFGRDRLPRSVRAAGRTCGSHSMRSAWPRSEPMGPRRQAKIQFQGARNRAKATATEKLMALEVLVVDDEADIRELVSGVLEDEGYAVRTAADSSAALDAIEERRPSLRPARRLAAGLAPRRAADCSRRSSAAIRTCRC